MLYVKKPVNIEFDREESETLYQAEILLHNLKEKYDELEVYEYPELNTLIRNTYNSLSELCARFSIHINLGVDPPSNYNKK